MFDPAPRSAAVPLVSCQTLGWYHSLFGGEAHAGEALAYIRRCGFDAIDYHFEGVYTANQIRNGVTSPVFDKPLDALLEYYAPLKQAIDTQGIVISQSHGISPQYLTTNRELSTYLRDVIRKSLEVCRFLGCPSMVLHPLRVFDLTENLRLFRELTPAALQAGVTVCLENMFIGNEPFYDTPTACQIIDRLNDEAGAPVFGACYDVGHANLSGRDLYRDICTLGDRLVCLHIHDNDGIHDQHLIPYTQKVPKESRPCTDWDGVWKGLAEIGYTGPINFEIHPALRIAPPELTEDLLKLAASIGRYIQTRITRNETP